MMISAIRFSTDLTFYLYGRENAYCYLQLLVLGSANEMPA